MCGEDSRSDFRVATFNQRGLRAARRYGFNGLTGGVHRDVYRTWKLKFGIEIATVPQQRTPGTITVVVQIQAPQRLSYSVM